VAVWCDGGVEARFDCRSKLNAGCGYVDLATGFFCRAEAQNPAPAPESPPVPDNPEGEAPVPEALEEPESNPEPSPEQSPEGGCGDLDYLGRCEGDMARWCDSSGQIQGVDCAGRGQSCGYVDEEVGYYCVDLPPVPEPEEVPPENGCGDVDYLGECAGDVARWCANGQISTLDCGSQGQVCGYVDDITGYYCREEAPQEQRPEAEPEAEPEVEPEPEPAPEFDGCDGVDFQGYCVGDVVHYCSSGQLVSMDCGVRDQTCGWVDDEVGNDCVEAN